MKSTEVIEFENKWEHIGLIQQLKESDINLYEYVVKNCMLGSYECDNINNYFDEYTDHSSNHSLEVLKNGNQIIEGIELNKVEIAIFTLACYFHDIGMNVDNEKLKTYKTEEDFPLEREYLIDKIGARSMVEEKDINDADIDKLIMLEYIRERHHKLSSGWIKNHYHEEEYAYIEIDNIYCQIWDFVANVCEAHCIELKEITDDDYGFQAVARMDIDMTFLACLLRLSDYCHIGRDRALPYIRTSKKFYSGFSKQIWESLARVGGVRFDKEKKCITITAECDDFTIQDALVNEAINIDFELHAQIKHLAQSISKKQYQYFFIDASKIKEKKDANYIYSLIGFKMNYNKITELLIGSKLYSEDLYALREILQNSMDSLSVQKMQNSLIDAYILINFHKDSEGKEIIDIYDNGVGMDKTSCSDHFLSIGDDSFWHTKKCLKEFGDAYKNTQIIASHGIGVLSYFLLSNEIEVFSKYKDAQSIHVQINKSNRNVIFLKTKEIDYPKFNQNSYLIQTPWQFGHGTCIRLNLREEQKISDIIRFLSQHILRINYNLFIINNENECEIIPQVKMPLLEVDIRMKKDRLDYENEFSYMDDETKQFTLDNAKEVVDAIQKSSLSFGEIIKKVEDDNVFQEQIELPEIKSLIRAKEKKEGLKELIIEQYKMKNPDFYNSDYDKLKYVKFNTNSIAGKIYLEDIPAKQIHNRLSQNGIWIRNGNKYIDSEITRLLGTGNNIFSYDIDISGVPSNLFNLTLSRDDIVECDQNRAIVKKVVNILIEQLPEVIKKIDYTIAFSCGKRWSHGIHELLFGCDSMFYDVYDRTLNEIDRIRQSGFLGEDIENQLKRAFDEAKIFHLFDINCNTSVSVNEIEKNIGDYKILLPLFVNSKESVYGIEENDRKFKEEKPEINLKKIANKRKRSIENYIKRSIDKIIIMPFFLQSFMMPILNKFILQLCEKKDDYVVYNLITTEAEGLREKNINTIKENINI
jgi:hypothetical protein